ncbi:MAG TPA: galactokinase family protein [Solirubrobacteraceae bacterium]
MPARRCRAFAPGRVNVIGEHTDYNDGLALPFAIAEGVTVRAESLEGPQQMEAIATDLDERDSFPLVEPGPGEGWRAYVHGAVAELAAARHPLVPARLEISGRVPLGSGLSSSAALTVALCLALLELGSPGAGRDEDRMALARLCSRVENEWAGARTGLLDQIASLFGAADTAILIDFQSLVVEPVELDLEGWRFVVADSGERHVHASSGYNERRRECAAACAELGIESLREASTEDLPRLSEPLEMRVRHVIGENARVLEAVAALRAGEIGELARLLNESHASLRDLYQVSTPAVEATVERLLRAGVAGARLIGGGFGGSVLGLLEPGLDLPPDSLEVVPGPGARILPH